MLTLERLNAATQAEFTALLDGTFEHSPWIAEASTPAERRVRATSATVAFKLQNTIADSGFV